MNLKTTLRLTTAILATIALTGCAAPVADSRPSRAGNAAAPAALECNLGIWIDRETNTVRPRYDAPVADSYEARNYGPLVAKVGCSDAEILSWQELRREFGESDQICRPVLKTTVEGSVYPIGCAVPQLVVSDAS